MNMDALSRPFNPSEIKQRKGPGGKMLDYLEAHSVIARLNEAFEGQWTFRVLDRIVTEEEIAVLGELTAENEMKQQWGSKTREEHVPLGDTIKAATSDALKKCSTLFGVGLHLYAEDSKGKHRQRGNGEETEAQRTLRERRRKMSVA